MNNHHKFTHFMYFEAISRIWVIVARWSSLLMIAVPDKLNNQRIINGKIPETNEFAPAAAHCSMFFTLTPPSTCISNFGYCARIAATFDICSAMNDCPKWIIVNRYVHMNKPPNPGSTVIMSTLSMVLQIGRIFSTGVFGLILTPTSILCNLIVWNKNKGINCVHELLLIECICPFHQLPRDEMYIVWRRPAMMKSSWNEFISNLCHILNPHLRFWDHHVNIEEWLRSKWFPQWSH